MNICAGCGLAIHDRFMLQAVDKLFHEECLKCACCQCPLSAVGTKMYYRQDMTLCATDYGRLYGKKGSCAECRQTIFTHEMIMKARDLVYHLRCFSCSVCNCRFSAGDKFYLRDGKILCLYDFEEQKIFRQAAYSNKSLTEITRNIQRLPESFELAEDEKDGRPPLLVAEFETNNNNVASSVS